LKIQRRQEKRPDSAQLMGPLFLNYRGGRLSVRSVDRLVKRYSRKCGITAEISPHSIRHYICNPSPGWRGRFKINPGIIRPCKFFQLTQKYTHVSIDKLMEVYDKSHPRS